LITKYISGELTLNKSSKTENSKRKTYGNNYPPKQFCSKQNYKPIFRIGEKMVSGLAVSDIVLNIDICITGFCIRPDDIIHANFSKWLLANRLDLFSYKLLAAVKYSV
jgi:hypothetical protein